MAGVVHVVDDEEPVRRSLALLLESADYEVQSYSGAQPLLAAAPARADETGVTITSVAQSCFQIQVPWLPRPVTLRRITVTATSHRPGAPAAVAFGYNLNSADGSYQGPTSVAGSEGTTGSVANDGCSRMRAVSMNPSMRGMSTSETTTSMASDCSVSHASIPSAATRTT